MFLSKKFKTLAVLMCFALCSCVQKYNSNKLTVYNLKKDEKLVFGKVKLLFADTRNQKSEGIPLLLGNMVIKSQNTYPKKYLISMSNEKDENGFQPFSLALVPGDYKISQIRINLSDYFIDGLLFNVSSSNNSSYIGDIEIFVDKSNKKFTIKIRDNIANNSNYTKSLVIKNNPSINSREKFFCHYGSCSPTSSNLNLPW